MVPRGLQVLVAAAGVVLAACTSTSGADPGASVDDPSASVPSAVTDVAPVPATGDDVAPATTAPPPPPTPPRVEDVVPLACSPAGRLDVRMEDPPPSLQAALDEALRHPAWVGLDVSVSVWVQGYGEVAARAPDQALLPASNQKVLTAIGAHLLIDPATRFVTEVRQEGSDLYLVAGGDPTLTAAGPHSLDELARQVRAAGVARVDRLVVDVTRFEAARTAPGWQDWHVPAYAGPLSALVVDDNRYRTDPAFVADPATANGEHFAERLRRQGVAVDGPAVVGVAPAGATEVGRVTSEPLSDLLVRMLRVSDNEVAESVLRLIGDGSTATGTARIHQALGSWCLELAGVAADGSGLSRQNLRSAREWRRLLQVAAHQPWADELRAALPQSGRSGTLAGRLAAPGVAGAVAAKTGTIIGGQALSGYATTASGRDAVFSIVANGEPGRAAGVRPAIDAVVTALVRHG